MSFSNAINLEDRKPIWIALSRFYLHTVLDDPDFKYIASTILKRPYTFDEVKTINKYEVFPILQRNLGSIAGVWAGFDEDWLVEKIVTGIKNKTRFDAIGVEINYQMNKWMTNGYWKKLEKVYNDIKINF